MAIKNKISTLLIGLLLTATSFGQTSKTATDYLGLTKLILFDKVFYNLAWTAHPTNNYYKQEYLAQGDTLEKFKRLITIDVLIGQTNIKDLVAAKIAELNKLKKRNPVINYETFEKGDETMFDFITSENTPDGSHLSIIERNVYRYKSVKDKNGQGAVLLFAVSDRAYGDAIDNFLSDLNEHRYNLLNLVGAVNFPEITIAK